MDIDETLDAGTLDPAWGLPLDRPFLSRAATEAGCSRRQLDQLVALGLLRRPVKGVLVCADVTEDVALRAESLRLIAPPDAVVTDRHAAWLHGAEGALAPGEHLALQPISVVLPPRRGRLRNSITAGGERDLAEHDVTRIRGLAVTTRLRTAHDLGRRRWPDEALAGVDAMHRLPGFDHAAFLAGIERYAGRRWIRTLREVGPLADGRAESPAESILRLRCLECGIDVVPQFDLWDGDHHVARFDLAVPELRIAFEYDGEEWHSTPEQREHDRLRREAARRLGWLIVVIRKEHLFGQSRTAETRIREGYAEALRRAGRSPYWRLEPSRENRPHRDPA
ncbi:hypothetical protein I601_3428 [Nocardioides dokdonensis FR1436]|uniref:DUF559 domain-containing protein n=1 Tax=Nocardioides dokdonensis FR1436 TaxID=1300347 RepID=A0A1A9GNG8_9ACTN|nr:hypothetical protein [Nocardioides dokdonensis]ANH39834.1 hypothetical protein I601_3428 [Nocardioides dokdonensis FR1436]